MLQRMLNAVSSAVSTTKSPIPCESRHAVTPHTRDPDWTKSTYDTFGAASSSNCKYPSWGSLIGRSPPLNRARSTVRRHHITCPQNRNGLHVSTEEVGSRSNTEIKAPGTKPPGNRQRGPRYNSDGPKRALGLKRSRTAQKDQVRCTRRPTPRKASVALLGKPLIWGII